MDEEGGGFRKRRIKRGGDRNGTVFRMRKIEKGVDLGREV